MNPFTTIPKAAAVIFGAMRYNRRAREFERLRAEGKVEEEKALIHLGQNEFIDRLSKDLKIDYEIIGEENIPESGPIMVYSNHQSFCDIFALLHLFHDHFGLGYVAKEEWRKYKPIADAIYYTRSIFLNRGNPKEAVRAIQEAKEVLDLGFSLVIFPEGTRSRKHEMGEFKPGAFKFAEKGKVPILPVTLDGGYKLLEEKGTYQPCTVRMTVHPLVHIEQMTKQEQKQAAIEIEETIRSALD